MKYLFFLIVLFFLNNCSFDNKTGIWKNESIVSVNDKNKEIFKDFKDFVGSENIFKKEIILEDKKRIKMLPPISNDKWSEFYYNNENNLNNFIYNDLNQIIFKSKKLTRANVNHFFIFNNGNIILSDDKGSIIIFSTKTNSVINKFNFYKKKYKKKEIKLNFYLEENIIYVSDNIGYLYSYDYLSNKVVWAINNKLPFKSNIKVFENKIVSSDINNNLIFFDKTSGTILKLIPTENNVIRNQFINNLSLTKDNLFFLNSYGSLYAIDNKKMKLNWFINLNPSLALNHSRLFDGSKIIANEKIVLVSSNNKTFIIDQKTSTILNKFNFSSDVRPIIHNNLIFLITKGGYLVVIDAENYEILYSKNISSEVSKFLDTKEKSLFFKDLFLLNDNITIFLNNSFVLEFKNTGELNNIKKLPSKIKSTPISINSKLIYLNKKNKLVILN